MAAVLQIRARMWSVALLAAAALLSEGCGGFLLRRAAVDDAKRARTPGHRAAERGVEALTAGNHERASRAFTEALSLDPENSKLHLLNGLAHHAGYLAGARARGPLAETAYRVALVQDSGSWRAAYQLGLLYLDMRHYAAAQATLAQAANIVSDQPGVFHA